MLFFTCFFCSVLIFDLCHNQILMVKSLDIVIRPKDIEQT